MATTIEETVEETALTRKTREFCQAILDEPSVQAIRQRIDSFMANDEARAQYDSLVAKGQALQQKQQMSQALTSEEIADFEQHRDSLLANPVAREFLDAQQEMHQVRESIQKQVNKTIELGRLPSEEDLSSGCCGDHSCGCGH
ncbi:MAG: YlbF family regulator [Verrucomicrobiota bacterium]|nr:YlbF family regulator [Verrucomicrobiota bacterium]